jgi:thioredoxin 1
MKRDVIMARCGPCKLIAPAIDEIASEYSPALKVCKLDTDSHPNVAERCGVYGLPTIALFTTASLSKAQSVKVPSPRTRSKSGFLSMALSQPSSSCRFLL